MDVQRVKLKQKEEQQRSSGVGIVKKLRKVPLKAQSEAVCGYGTRRGSLASSICFPHQATILPEPPGHEIPQTGSMPVSPPLTVAAAQVL